LPPTPRHPWTRRFPPCRPCPPCPRRRRYRRPHPCPRSHRKRRSRQPRPCPRSRTGAKGSSGRGRGRPPACTSIPRCPPDMRSRSEEAPPLLVRRARAGDARGEWNHGPQEPAVAHGAPRRFGRRPE
jgi:hypothetical protein